MTDLLAVVPDLPPSDFANILPALERNNITTSDILTLTAVEIAKQAQVPVRHVYSLTAALQTALHASLDSDRSRENAASPDIRSNKGILKCSGRDLLDRWKTLSTLDDGLDDALGGGFPLGCLSEVTGERYALEPA